MQGGQANGPARRRALLVEDESMVAILLEDMLDELGFDVVGVASRLETGLAAADQADVDVAVLDVNLGGLSRSFVIADRLRERGIPFVFATGYGRQGLGGAYPDIPVVQKPFRRAGLLRALVQVMTAATATSNTRG